ncbi:MAG: hypothetical protein ACFCVD_14155 [Nodosilinea sp.]
MKSAFSRVFWGQEAALGYGKEVSLVAVFFAQFVEVDAGLIAILLAELVEVHLVAVFFAQFAEV